MKVSTGKLLLFYAIIWLSILSCKKSEISWDHLDDILSEMKRPEFKDSIFNIIEYGAVSDRTFNSGKAIAQAISACNNNGGGIVLVPEGVFNTGPIHLLSNVNLHLEKGAVLLFSTDPKDYLPVVHTSWSGSELLNYSPLIYAYRQQNIGLTGEGLVDGQASYENWWEWNRNRSEGWLPDRIYEQDSLKGSHLLFRMVKNELPIEERVFGDKSALRPQFIQFFDCKNILIEGLTIHRSPYWIVHPIYCENVFVERLTIRSHGPNNDGCDPEYSRNVLIRDCLFDTGDDCIAIKSGRDEDGRKASTPSENIVVQGCIMYDGHGGIVLGSETSSGVRNVFVEDCVMDSPELNHVLRLKSNAKRGSIIENIFMRNIEVGQVKISVFRFNMKYDNNPKGKYLPSFRSIFVENVNVKNGGRYGIDIIAFKESPVRDMYFKNIVIDSVGSCLNMDYYENIRLEEFYCNGTKVEL
jgi:polygalacturonase